jgi:hypothetical protein
MSLLIGGTAAGQSPTAQDTAVDAYIYGYPLVLMEFTRADGFNSGMPLNGFTHRRNLLGPANTAVVHPNNDTLYSTAFLDLKAEPLVLHVPEAQGRYYLMQMLDAWTNTFANPGSRTTGGAAYANWLPTPPTRFSLSLRLYAPREAVLKGNWAPPPVVPAASAF